MKLTDKQIIEQIGQGNAEGYEFFIKEYQARIYNFIYRMVENREDASDLTQETFIKIFEKAGDLSKKETLNLKAYLYKTAQNTTLNEIKKRKRERPKEDLEVEDINVYQDPERALLLKEQIEKTRKVAGSMSEGHRVVLSLKELQELNYKDIAEIMGMTKTAVGVLLMRARLKFKEGYAMSEIQKEELSKECKEILPLISSYLDKETTREESKQVEKHLAECPLCSLARDELADASTSYRVLLPVIPPVGILGSLHEKIFELMSSYATPTARAGMSWFKKTMIGIPVIALTLILVTGAAYIYQRINEPVSLRESKRTASSKIPVAIPEQKKSSKIAFVRDGDIWIMNPDGSGQEKLTKTGKARSPSWSPDGTNIAFFDDSDDSIPMHPIYIYDLKTSKVKHVKGARSIITRETHPVRFVDNETILYLDKAGAGASMKYQINKINISENSEINIDILEIPNTQHEFLEDISSLDVTQADGGKLILSISLYRIDEMTGPMKRVFISECFLITSINGDIQKKLVPELNFMKDTRYEARNLKWSPDGKQFSFSGAEEGTNLSLIICDTETDKFEVVVRPSYDHIHQPTWSSDGQKIAYHSIGTGGEALNEIWVAGSNGKKPHRIAENAAQPAWSPELAID